LDFAFSQQISRNDPQDGCGDCQNGGEKSNPCFGMPLNDLSAIEKEEKRQLMSGAIFLGGLWVFFTYLCIIWDKERCQKHK
jgi:hypothetical protein